MPQDVAQKNRRSLKVMCFVVFGMFGFGFAMVPIYNVLCNATGLNGKTGGAVNYFRSQNVDKSRTVTVEFLSTNNAYLPWDFYPKVKKVKLHPGEMTRITYFGRNNTDMKMTIQAIPSVTPGIAAKYLKKTECFCFTRQTLKGHASQDFPILFHLDPALPRDVKTITLSYTLFDVAKLGNRKFKFAGHITK